MHPESYSFFQAKINAQSYNIGLILFDNLATHKEWHARRWCKFFFFSAGFLLSKTSDHSHFFPFILNYNSMWWKANCTGARHIYFVFVNTLFETLQNLPGKVLFDCVFFCIWMIQMSFSKCFFILRHAQFPYLIIKQSITHCKSVGIQQ